jgi:4a-hydroxytetrahydrobiopterin dehydratase
VLHGGAMAVFRVLSMVEAARLAEAVAQVPQLDGAGLMMTIADDHLAVRLICDVWHRSRRTARVDHGTVVNSGQQWLARRCQAEMTTGP